MEFTVKVVLVVTIALVVTAGPVVTVAAGCDSCACCRNGGGCDSCSYFGSFVGSRSYAGCGS